jgi:hypothetical protein
MFIPGDVCLVLSDLLIAQLNGLINGWRFVSLFWARAEREKAGPGTVEICWILSKREVLDWSDFAIVSRRFARAGVFQKVGLGLLFPRPSVHSSRHSVRPDIIHEDRVGLSLRYPSVQHQLSTRCPPQPESFEGPIQTQPRVPSARQPNLLDLSNRILSSHFRESCPSSR